MVRRVWAIVLAAFLAMSLGVLRISAQDQAPPPKDQMFSGTITAISPTSLTAARTGSKDSKTFTITPETRFEGPKPQVDSRVTIRYVSTPDGDRAVRVIVRSPAKK